MSHQLLEELAAYVPRDRAGAILEPDAALARDGVALIADISGFTPLTEAMAQSLSADRGAEELTAALGRVFEPLVAQVHAYGGSVIRFAGDALIVWVGRRHRERRSSVIRRAITSAWQMQDAMREHGRVSTPLGPVTLTMKIGVAYGPVMRLSLGDPAAGLEDVIVGATLDHMSEAEHLAGPGDIVLHESAVRHAGFGIGLKPAAGGELLAFAVVTRLNRPALPTPWPRLPWPHQASPDLVKAMAAYVPRPVVETLEAGRDQVAELKPVVSLFVQFQGLDFERDIDAPVKLQTYFSAAQRVAERYGGRLNRLISGDKGSVLHVLFGAPRSVEGQHMRAARCALDLQAECGGLPFITTQRIGISAGRAFAGPVGARVRHDYTTMGDTINLSARLMQNAAPDQVLIDGAMRAELDESFEIADLGSLQVKGKALPVPICAILRHQEADRSGVKRGAVALVGRERETAILCAAIDRTLAGHFTVVTLSGEAGMGKSQLLAELRREGRIAWAEGSSRAYGEVRAGQAFVEALHDLAGISPAADPAQAAQRLLHYTAGLFGEDRLASTYPYLARFLGLPLDAEYAARLEDQTGESVRWQVFAAIREMLELAASREPHALVLHDVHWADATTMQLVSTLALEEGGARPDAPLLLILSMRPDSGSAAWRLRQSLLKQATPGHVDVALRPLEDEASLALINQAAPHLPASAARRLVEKGAGNPLLLSEMVRTMRARGLLTGDIDAERLTVEASDLSTSIQELLLAQIDRLPSEARHLLQTAAVIGQDFSAGVLAEAIEQGEPGHAMPPAQLALLEAGDFIVRRDRSEGGDSYRFRHVLIQESAYGMIPYQVRRGRHRAIAATTERLFPGQIDERAGFLGFHYERGEDVDRASYYHLQAADQARLLFAHDEAEELYRKVLGLLDGEEGTDGSAIDPGRRASIYFKLAQVQGNRHDFESAQRYCEQAFQLFDQAWHDNPAGVDSQEAPVIRLGVLEHGPFTLDPGLHEYASPSEIVEDLFEGLVELDADLNVVPALARRWHVEPGGMRYRFELQPGLLWSDGAPLTAHDFVFAWRRNLNPATEAGLASDLYVVKGAEACHQGLAGPEDVGVRALDDLTLEVELESAAPYLPMLLAQPIAYPQPAHAVLRHGLNWSRPENLVCNGPYRIVSWQEGECIRLERNPFYRGRMAGNIRQAALRFLFPNFAEYERREIDWCMVEDQPDICERHPDEYGVLQYLQTAFVGFACRYPPFRDGRVRQAFALAVDQTALCAEAWAGVQRPALGGSVPPGMSGHSPEIGHPFDPERARGLLAEAQAWQEAMTSPLVIAAGGPGFQQTPYVLQRAWREHLGVHVDVSEGLSIEAALEKFAAGDIHMLLFAARASWPDPGTFLGAFVSDNPINAAYFGWQCPAFDRMLARAEAESDQTSQLRLFHEADRILVREETGVLPLYYGRAYSLLRSGFRMAGGGRILRGGAFRLKNIIWE